ncbi:metal-dependent hydrolase [Haloarcula taiwanensis]|uniref:Metal-dependent hydrolase n=1 Tax=Haloarcula taiwanensis TaxID=1932004 RepID=A0A2H4ZXM9_9EURY|nr:MULTISPECIES: metal-dependent hydrolase [Haloarcula]AUG47225.1 metal-dependent hydrolase [Haloarcula taiwanensis]RLM33470.1 metal-dependent hydrolase [Haloarcula sp. Atlit-120R]RLM42128.1 metal-dependent hydrolase [Haloarcula sp. Atlit-47R]RLM95493.1 metal-dependent hydrolase [Haloarcula sp. Atlit-7R]
MPDLLSHAFIAFTICTLLSLRYNWLTGEYVTVGMAGAFIPDMAKIKLLVDAAAVEAALGIPFNWLGIHTLGGAFVAVLVGTVVVNRADRRRVFMLLSLGAVSHLLADSLLLKASGRSYEVLWPLTQYHPPTPGLYLSTDIWLTGVTGSVAVAVYFLVQYRA